MTQYATTIYSPSGDYLQRLRWRSIDCTIVERGIGTLTINLFPEYRDDLFARDCRIALHRAPDWQLTESGKLVGDAMWLLTQRKRTLDQNGEHQITLSCQHPNALLGRRVVAYAEDSANAHKSDQSSAILYDFINENFVAATDTARNISTAHFVLDPEPNPSFGPSTEIEGSYRNIMDIIRDVTQSAAAQDSYVGYEVYVQSAPGPFRVRLYNRVRGTNRGFSSGQTLIVGPYSAKMTRVDVSEDWAQTVTYAYAGGAGNQDERIVAPQEDTTLSAQSPFGRSERFESFNTIDSLVLTANAYKMLRDFRPHRNFSATIVPYTEQYSGAVYDVNYTWGDIVGAQFNAPVVQNGQLQSWITYSFDCRVNPVHLRASRTFDEFGNPQATDEQIEITLQSVSSS